MYDVGDIRLFYLLVWEFYFLKVDRIRRFKRFWDGESVIWDKIKVMELGRKLMLVDGRRKMS